MKRLFTFMLLLYGVEAISQKANTFVNFQWNGSNSSLNATLKLSADSLVNNVLPGTLVKVNVLSASEMSLPEKEKGIISYDRVNTLMKYCSGKKLPLNEYYAAVVPFDVPNTLRTNNLENAAYRSYKARAICFLMLSQPELAVTSNPSVNFDASVNDDIQRFSFAADEDIYAYLPSGSSVFIPGGSLRFANGQGPGCDSVVLHVAEYNDMAAMAMKAMTTTSSGKKLNTAGMFYIQVTCGGKPLVMSPGKYYSIHIATSSVVPGMRVFTGQMKNNMLNWKEETDGKVITSGLNNEIVNENRTDNVYDSTYLPELDPDAYERRGDETDGEYDYEGPGYTLQLNDFGWINCDAFDETEILTDFHVRGEVNDETSVMLVYGKRKSVLPGYLSADGKTVVFSDIASDETAMLVVYKMDKKKGTAEKFTKIITPGKDKSCAVSLSKSTIEELRAEVKNKMADFNY